MPRAQDTQPYRLDPETGSNDSQTQLVVKPLKSWKGYIWDTWELPQDQRWLLFKVDAFVLTFASVSPQNFRLKGMQISDKERRSSATSLRI